MRMDENQRGGATHLPRVYRAPAASEVVIRPASPADAPAVQTFVRRLSPETRRKRFFGPILELSPEQLARVTSCASPDDLNLVVADRRGEIVAMAQCVSTGTAEAEFALVVADSWQRQGIGTALCGVLSEHARARRLASLAGFILAENRAMLGLAAKLGFSLTRDSDATLIRAVMVFAAPRPAAPQRADCGQPTHAAVAA